MELSKNEFKVLRQLIDETEINQREIGEKTDLSLGTVNKCLKRFRENGLIDADYKLTEKGKRDLEPYEVKRAIIMAAGFGSRMVPVTLTTPKPLVKVNGVRIIDRLIDGLLAKGIDEIIVVRGYLKHKFNELVVKYPMIKFVDNDLYNEANNIYSIYLVRDKLENAYIFEGDLVLYNVDALDKYHYSSDFLAFPVEESDDWCLPVKNGRIVDFVRGGTNTYQEIGISYWTKEDGQKLYDDIEEVMNMPGGKELLWENVPLVKKNRNYDVAIKECKREDIVEIDTFNELCELDPSYRNYSNSGINIEKTIIKNICSKLDCQEEDIRNIEFMKIGLTNISFKFTVNGVNYVYRSPGVNTKKYINRKSEIFSEKIAKELGLDTTVVHIDESGWKLSRYAENTTHINPYDVEDQKRAMAFIRRLHDRMIVSDYDFDYMTETKRFIQMFDEEGVDFSEHEDMQRKIEEINDELQEKGYQKVLCHNDFWFWNILKNVQTNELTLIDWEYSGNSYPASDVAYFVSSLNYDNEDYLKLAQIYEGHSLDTEERWYYNAVLALVMWYWYAWAIFKEYNGKIIEDKQMWYDKVVDAIEHLED